MKYNYIVSGIIGSRVQRWQVCGTIEADGMTAAFSKAMVDGLRQVTEEAGCPEAYSVTKLVIQKHEIVTGD